MKDTRWNQLVDELGSVEKAEAVLRIMQPNPHDLELTDNEQAVLEYLRNRQPIINFRQLAVDTGTGTHTHQGMKILSSLVRKGYLVPIPE